ncbi:MAG: hypothetical protein OEN52_05425 [Gammaproteobacteria bacterium]|nr:hypothetical protein [Gammaproteobacteria bacterium]MDH3560378.1 hypothetical protein [Gammaproteobacteria bacterium]
MPRVAKTQICWRAVILHRIETTDPITGRDIEDLTGIPYIVEQSASEDLVIDFESEESKRRNLDIPVEHPIDHHVNLVNPPDIMIDEG